MISVVGVHRGAWCGWKACNIGVGGSGEVAASVCMML